MEVLWPKKLYPKLAAGGTLCPEAIRALHRSLGGALLPGVGRADGLTAFGRSVSVAQLRLNASSLRVSELGQPTGPGL